MTSAGVIRVCARQAKELPLEGVLGRQDPYVRFTVGRKSAETRIAEHGGVAPVWHIEENFEFELSGEDTVGLKVEVFDHRKLMSDHLIAHTAFPIRSIMHELQGTAWHNLVGNNGGAAGRVELSLTWIPPLEITVLRADRLPVLECCLFTQHPFARLLWDKKPYNVAKRTPPCREGHTVGVWNDGNTFLYNTPFLEVPLDDDMKNDRVPDPTLTIEILGEGRVTDKLLSSVQLKYRELMMDADRGLEKPYPLQTISGGDGGVLLLKLQKRK